MINQIKHEYIHQNRLCNVNLVHDAEISKRFFESFSIRISNSAELKGYIHGITVNPFGYTLISELQVKIKSNLIFNYFLN